MNVKKLALSLFFFFIAHIAAAQRMEMAALKNRLPHIKEKQQYIDALNRLAMLSHLRYKDSCLVYASKAMSLSEQAGYKKGIADALNCEAIYYMSVNNYLSARYFNDALQLYRQLEDRENEAQLLMNLSVLLYTNNNPAEAVKYIYRAEKLSRSLQNDSIRSIILSDILTLDHKLPLAKYKAYYDEGLGIAKKHKDYRMIISYENNRGTLLYNDGRKAEGIAILERSEKLADSVGCEYVQTTAFMTLGEMMLDLKRNHEGIAYYEKGLQHSELYGYPESYTIFADRLYQFYKAQGDSRSALKYLSLLQLQQNKIQESMSKSGFNYVNYVEKDNEIDSLEKHRDFQTQLLIVLGTLLIALLGIAFLYYRLNQSKKKSASIQQQLQEALSKHNTELEAQVQFNNMLITVLAHDVRQPFSNVIMATELFTSPNDIPEDQKSYILKELELTARQSMFFMDGVLSWIKSKESGYAFGTEPIHLAEMVQEANSFFVPVQRRKDIVFHSAVPPSSVLNTSKMVLLFVLRNILNNATSYSPAGASIDVHVTHSNDYSTVSVTDTGRGMSAKAAANLFRISHKQESKGKKGAGVALALSYEMMARIGGSIAVESTEGKGTVFYIKIPTDPNLGSTAHN
ncbi:hypothetical protein FNO01nite_04890 [Flavobacterium noncentrifugens]|nr:hypothetical protein FNO01nite_04890 [Flavobacterium noncentrifugens]